MSNEQDELVKMVVDDEKCIGAGQCEMLEEEVFFVDDDTVIAGVIGTGMLPADRAQDIVDTCPAQAISFVDAAEAAPASGEE